MLNGFLLLTHSSRLTRLKDCSLNYLTQRYSNENRLDDLPRITDLLPNVKDTQSKYNGALSLFKYEYNKKVPIEIIVSLRLRSKVQHAVLIDLFQILICYESCLELIEFDQPLNSLSSNYNYKSTKRYDHPHFAGLHTVNMIDNLRVVLSASAPDSIYILDISNGKIEHLLRMPESIYGENYKLNNLIDLREHYINNDIQTTHVNSAYPSPCKKKIVVSTLIQGAIGIYDIESKSYKEIIRGFIGCHGARFNSDNEIYFCDSTNGTMIILNNKGQIKYRFHTKSFWLHDAIQLHKDIYAFSLSDKNELAIYDIKKHKLIFKKHFFKIPKKLLDFLSNNLTNKFLGNSTQFLNIYKLT